MQPRDDDWNNAWFLAGETVYRTDTDDDSFFPVVTTSWQDQRRWLDGFVAAWATSQDDTRTARTALAERLSRRPDLLQQMEIHRIPTRPILPMTAGESIGVVMFLIGCGILAFSVYGAFLMLAGSALFLAGRITKRVGA